MSSLAPKAQSGAWTRTGEVDAGLAQTERDFAALKAQQRQLALLAVERVFERQPGLGSVEFYWVPDRGCSDLYARARHADGREIARHLEANAALWSELGFACGRVSKAWASESGEARATRADPLGELGPILLGREGFDAWRALRESTFIEESAAPSADRGSAPPAMRAAPRVAQ